MGDTDEAESASGHPHVKINENVQANQNPSFTLGEMVDLALCSPEIGAVNFNILRMLLRDVIEKTGIDKSPVNVSDLEAHQVENFKNYVQGTQVASPMPGVLRIGQQGPPPAATGRKSLKTPRSTRPGDPVPAGAGGAFMATSGGFVESVDADELTQKVSRLEKQLEAMYELPSNNELIDTAKGHGKSIGISDMWQIIQLNNRIAAAEAAIQKMASLIEDLAKNLGRVKGEAKTLKKDTKDLATTSSDLAIQGQEMIDKYGQFDDVIGSLQKELNEIKMGWKLDRENLEKVLGVDLGKIPTFMRPKHRRGRDEPVPVDGRLSSQFERSTQTFMKQEKPKKRPDQFLPPEEIAKMTPDEIIASITPEELTRMTPEIYKTLTFEQKKILGEIRKSGKTQEPPKPPLGVEKMNDEQLAELTPSEILNRMPYDEAMELSQEVLDRMTDEQKQMVRKVIERGPPKRATSRRDLKGQKQKQVSLSTAPPPKRPKQPKMGIVSMTRDQLKEISAAEIAQKMPYEEAKNIPQNVLDKMRMSQQEAIKKIMDAGPPPGYKEKPTTTKSHLGIASMTQAELDEVTDTMIAEMPYIEAKKIPQEVIQQMTPEQQAALQKVIDAGPPKRVSEVDSEYDEEDLDESKRKSESGPEEKRKSRSSRLPGLSTDELEDIADTPAYEIAETLTPEQAAGIPDEELKKRFTEDQIKEIERLKEEQKRKSRRLSGADGRLDLEQAAEMTPDELIANLTEEQLEGLSMDEVMDMLPPDKAEAIMEAKRSLEDEDAYTTDASRDEEEESRGRRKSHKKHRKDKKHKHEKHLKKKEDGLATKADILKGPIPEVKEELPPMSLEEYLGSLPPEEAASLAADAVQKELEKQYRTLQGMQRQLAQDIQEKMEFIYQKLLREIASQQTTTTPYMVLGQEVCLGPGICTGHGMPAGLAVCQFPEALEEGKKPKKSTAAEEDSPCPGPGPCPGKDVCPYCLADASARDALQSLKQTEGKKSVAAKKDEKVKKSTETGPGAHPHRGSAGTDEMVLKEMKSLMMLDLDQIRSEMKAKKFGAYDEQDILERLGAVWEALKILKFNEETIAVKIARQDAFMKKLPSKTVEKLQKIPEENLDALISGDFAKFHHMDERRGSIKGHAHDLGHLHAAFAPGTGRGSGGGGGGADKEEITTLYDNLANVISECADQKTRIDQIADTARILESVMVTKQMLIDAISDKADRGLINTKVSYEEFGNTVDELNTQLHNLMVEGYQRNENWKQVTTDLADELARKLDTAEVAPLRAFFKSRLKGIEEKVANISRIVDEPDPAGTRKKLLRDVNCISCDRVVNIRGVTNGPTLPTIGPIPAGHQTASKRALDLHRMRMAKKCEPTNCKKNVNTMERQRRQNELMKKQTQAPPLVSNPAQMARDLDVMQVINRYTGGSHTTLTTAEITAAGRRTTDPEMLTSMARGIGDNRNSNANRITVPRASNTGGQVHPSVVNLPPVK